MTECRGTTGKINLLTDGATRVDLKSILSSKRRQALEMFCILIEVLVYTGVSIFSKFIKLYI